MNNNKQDVMDILCRVNRKMFTGNGGREDSFIGRGQINILKEIIKKPNITQDQLADILKLDKTTIAKAVKRMELKGLVTRIRSLEDQRKKQLEVTEKALCMQKKMKKHVEDYASVFFDGISNEELEQFKDTLEKIENNIEKNRMMVNHRKHMGIKVIKYIKDNQGIERQDLIEHFAKDGLQVNKIVEKLIGKEYLEEKENKLYVTENAIHHMKVR